MNSLCLSLMIISHSFQETYCFVSSIHVVYVAVPDYHQDKGNHREHETQYQPSNSAAD